MVDAPTSRMHIEPGTLYLQIDAPALAGDRLAALLDAFDNVVNERVRLDDFQTSPVRMELSGSWTALDRIRSALATEEISTVLGTCRPTAQLQRGQSTIPKANRTGRRILLIDSDVGRGRSYTEMLSRDGIDVFYVSRGAGALRILQRTQMSLDAIVMRNRLIDMDGREVLRRLSPTERHCSILVIDDHIRADIAAQYRSYGVFRYIAPPDGPLQLISRVNAVISDTLAWRNVVSPTRATDEEPPRQVLDPDQAADRLQYICSLSEIEREVARMILLGKRDLDIAKCLGKSERTAKRHIGRVLEKAGIQNRASLWGVLHQDGSFESSARDDLPSVEIVVGRDTDAGLVREFIGALRNSYTATSQGKLVDKERGQGAPAGRWDERRASGDH